MKKKRLLRLFLCLLSGLLFAFAIACGHTHTYEETWTTDATHHWKASACGHAEEKSDYAAHEWDNAHACTQCGYQGEHAYSAWESLENGKHRKTCVCGDSMEENCGGGTATCKTLATCTQCEKGYGSLNADNHESAQYTYAVNGQDSGKHDKKYACCGALVETVAHTWDEGTPDADPDLLLFTCTACGTTKTEDAPDAPPASNPDDDPDAPPAHIHSATHVGALSPNCTTAGNLEYWYCEGCNTRFSNESLTTEISVADSTLPAAHTRTDYVYAVNAQDGTKHDKKRACCGEIIETTSHEWDDGVPDTNPALLLFTCEKCEATKTEDAPVSGHVHRATRVASLPPSCTTDGNTQYWYCAGCQTKFGEEELITPLSDSSIVWEKTGHSVDRWFFEGETLVNGKTCEYTQNYVGNCSVCAQQARKTVTAEKHALTASITTPAKCNENGSKTYVCKHGCAGVSEVKSYADPNAHAWVKGTVSGNVTPYTCSHCSQIKTVVEYSAPTATVDKSLLTENEISLGGISLKLDTNTLNLVENGEVSVEANTLSPTQKESLAANLTGSLRDTVLNGIVYNFGIKQNDTYISNFEGGTVKITLPYTPVEGEDVDRIAICYVADDGDVEIVAATYANGYVTFEAKHFSAYFPTSVSGEEACAVYGHNYTQEITPATCTTRGYTVKNCERCGNSVVTDVVYEYGHLWDNGTGTSATCTQEGAITYACTRTGCDGTLSVTVAKIPHSYVPDEENSLQPTCTEGGYVTNVCSVCDDRVVTYYEAYGHETQFGRAHYSLVQGATDCTGGIIEKRYCYIDGCDYFEIVDTHYEHIPLFIKGMNLEYYPEVLAKSITINVLDYADFDYLQYMGGSIQPTLTIMPGCLCGVLAGSVELNGGDMSMEYLYYSMDSSPQEEPRLIHVDGQMYGNPVDGFAPDFYMLFALREEVDVCHYTVYLDIAVGCDEEGNNAAWEKTVFLGESDNHTIVKSIAAVDPDISCFENSVNYSYEGLIETSTCSVCNDVIEERYVSVSSSSAHYYVMTPGEYYQIQRPVSGSSTQKHYITYYLQYCPCGTTQVYFSGSSCSYQYTTTVTVDGAEVDIYTCSRCNYAYGKLIVNDNSTCYKTTITTYYLNYNVSAGTYGRKLSATTGYYYHNQIAIDTDLPFDDPCYKKYDRIYKCRDCDIQLTGIFYNDGVFISPNHDENTTVTVDEHGNVTTNITCKREGCVYSVSQTRTASGYTLRYYSVNKDPKSGNVVKSLRISAEVNGEIQETFYRYETYDSEGELISWIQTSTSFGYNSNYGYCTRIVRSSNSSGEYHEYVYENCYFGEEHISQMTSCTQEGYDYVCCEVCGRRNNYSYPEPPFGHYYDPVYGEDGTTVVGYFCMRCGFESTQDTALLVELERLNTYDNDGMLCVGYYNRHYSEGQVGIDAQVSLVITTFDMEGNIIEEEVVTTVEIIDDNASKLFINQAELQAILDEYDGNCAAMLKVELNDGGQNLHRIKLL